MTFRFKSSRSKYGAKRAEAGGIRFDSKKEARRYLELAQLQKAGEISNLERQVRIPLIGRDGPIRTPTGRQAYYVADFVYLDWRKNGVKIIEDSKGYETREFKLKRAILAAQGVEVTLS